jgi:hypothetical protein
MTGPEEIRFKRQATPRRGGKDGALESLVFLISSINSIFKLALRRRRLVAT